MVLVSRFQEKERGYEFRFVEAKIFASFHFEIKKKLFKHISRKKIA